MNNQNQVPETPKPPANPLPNSVVGRAPSQQSQHPVAVSQPASQLRLIQLQASPPLQRPRSDIENDFPEFDLSLPMDSDPHNIPNMPMVTRMHLANRNNSRNVPPPRIVRRGNYRHPFMNMSIYMRPPRSGSTLTKNMGHLFGIVNEIRGVFTGIIDFSNILSKAILFILAIIFYDPFSSTSSVFWPLLMLVDPVVNIFRVFDTGLMIAFKTKFIVNVFSQKYYRVIEGTLLLYGYWAEQKYFLFVFVASLVFSFFSLLFSLGRIRYTLVRLSSGDSRHLYGKTFGHFLTSLSKTCIEVWFWLRFYNVTNSWYWTMSPLIFSLIFLVCVLSCGGVVFLLDKKFVGFLFTGLAVILGLIALTLVILIPSFAKDGSFRILIIVQTTIIAFSVLYFVARVLKFNI